MNNLFHLHKFVWTEADFEQMNWRDASVYAFAFLPERTEFVLDIDYVLGQMNQSENKDSGKFMVAPATLVFENVRETRIELEPNQKIEITNIERAEPRNPKNTELLNRALEWKWVIKTNQGEINLRSTGFKQHFKGMPIFGSERSLDLDLRGGFSFSRAS